MNKIHSQYIVVASILLIGIVVASFFIFSGGSTTSPATQGNSVTTENGKEVIHMVAKTGYSPSSFTIHSGKDAVLEVETRGTFDCSSGINIPSLGIRQFLPSSGRTQIPIPAQKAGTQINGTCSMGMYRFTINVI